MSAQRQQQLRRQRPALLLLVLVAGTAAAAAADALVFPQVPVDWSLVPATDAAAQAADLGSSCACALLNATCTPGCCCDAACPADVVARFRAAGACLREGPPAEQLTYCLPDEPFAKVNLPAGDFYRLPKAAADTDFLTQLLCVTRDHNPSLGASYPDPPAGDVGSNAAEAACPAGLLQAAPLGLAGSQAAPSYTHGAVLIVQGAIPPAAAATRVRGAFVLPVGVLSGECQDVQQVGFMQRLPQALEAQASSCSRTFASAAALAAMCTDATSPLSPTYWAGLAFPPSPASSELRPVALAALARRDPASGALTQLDPAADLAAPGGSAGPPAACAGVVVEAHFVMRFAVAANSSGSGASSDDGSYVLSEVALSLVLADVAQPAGGAPLVVSTAFSVAWAVADVPAAALQLLSGAPGYLPGFPLQAGVVVTAAPTAADAADATTEAAAPAQAVARLRDGLQLPGAGPSGRCSPDPQHAPAIAFGYNLTSTCSVGLTLGQLRTLCTSNNATKPLTDVMGAAWLGNLTSGQVAIGMWGNSHPASIQQWVRVATSGWPPTTDLAWDEATATCHNVPSGLEVRVLTGVAFASGNLQSKVLFASACVTSASWSYDRLNGAPGPQAFPMAFGAHFVAKAGQAAVVASRPAPPLMQPLPPDLFYPFLTSGSARAGPRALLVLAAALAAAAMLWL